MTKLDRSVPFYRVLMIKKPNQTIESIPLKEGYAYVPYDESLNDAWCDLHVETGLFQTYEQAKQKLNEMLQEDATLFREAFVFVKDREGNLVGSAGLWHGKDFKEERLRIHYVSVSFNAQHQKIAQSMITSLCVKYNEMKREEPLYLVTQSQSYGAIMLYQKLGFQPYLEETLDCKKEEHEKAWEKTMEIIHQQIEKRNR